MMNLKEALRWIADLFEEPVENIQPDTLREAVQAWDSLGVLTLMAKLDEDFDIQLPEEEIQGLKKIGDILKILSQQGKLNLEAS
jgi:acyl carrier protein